MSWVKLESQLGLRGSKAMITAGVGGESGDRTGICVLCARWYDGDTVCGR